MSTHSKQLDALLRRLRSSTEQQIAAVKSLQFATLEVEPNGETIDRTQEYAATLERTLHDLDDAIELAGKLA